MKSEDKHILIERYARGREDSLIESYIENGPTQLREELGLTEENWSKVFDHLVFEHNLLYKAVTHSADFFLETFIEHGTTHVRDILNIADSKYDAHWELLFDFIAISKDGLYYHVLEHRDRYMMAFKVRGGDFVRKVLGLWKDKYDENWLKILNVLLHAVCDSIFTENTFDHSLRAFSLLINGMRVHRVIGKIDGSPDLL